MLVYLSQRNSLSYPRSGKSRKIGLQKRPKKLDRIRSYPSAIAKLFGSYAEIGHAVVDLMLEVK